MRTIAILMLSALACGGEAYDPEGDAPEQEIGEAEQPVSFAPAWGFLTDIAENVRCQYPQANNSRVCVLPPNKSGTFRVTGTGMSAGQKTEAEGLVDSWIGNYDEEMTGWTLGRVTTGTADVNISYATLPGTNKNSIHTYVRCTAATGTTLDDFGSTGTWVKYSSVACNVDRPKILRDFNVAQQPRVLRHAIDYAMFKGVGIGSGGGAQKAYSIPVTPDTIKDNTISPFMQCMVDMYDPSGSTIFPVCGFEFIPCPCTGLSDN